MMQKPKSHQLSALVESVKPKLPRFSLSSSNQTLFLHLAGFEFKIKGGGKYDGDKFVLDVHMEGGNVTTTLAPTISSFTTSPGLMPNQTSTIMPSQTPTPSSALNATTAPPTTTGTTLSVNSSTTPAVSSNATTAPGEEVNVTPPTPAPEFNDHLKAGVSNLCKLMNKKIISSKFKPTF